MSFNCLYCSAGLGRCKQKQRGLRGYFVAGPPLLNGRCTSLLSPPVSEMTYTVSSGTLNPNIPYTILYQIRSICQIRFPELRFRENLFQPELSSKVSRTRTRRSLYIVGQRPTLYAWTHAFHIPYTFLDSFGIDYRPSARPISQPCSVQELSRPLANALKTRNH